MEPMTPSALGFLFYDPFRAFTLSQPFTQYSPSFSWVAFEVCFGSLSTHCVLLSTQQSNFAALGWIWAEGLASKCAIVQNVDSSLSACGTGYLCFTRLHSSRTCLAFLGLLGSDWHNLIKRWAWGSMQTPTADFKWTLNNKNNHSSTISAAGCVLPVLYRAMVYKPLYFLLCGLFLIFFDWDNEMSTFWRVFYSWLFGMKGVFCYWNDWNDPVIIHHGCDQFLYICVPAIFQWICLFWQLLSARCWFIATASKYHNWQLQMFYLLNGSKKHQRNGSHLSMKHRWVKFNLVQCDLLELILKSCPQFGYAISFI